MKTVRFVLLALLASATVSAPGAGMLDELVSRVRREARQDRVYDEAREQRFLQERNRQQDALSRLREELGRADKQADRLASLYEQQESGLDALERRIASEAGELGELLAMVQQSAAEIASLLDRSMVSAQNPERGAFREELAQRETAVSMDTLKRLWLLVLDEINESGEVARFSGPVITLDGEELVRPITRIGVFSAITEGRYLRYLPESRKLVELARQPAPRFQEMARKLEQADQGWRTVAVDPSKGAILALLVQSPDFRERIGQSGAIGYLILAIGALGLVIVVWRLVLLRTSWVRVKRQLGRQDQSGNNPLGRLLRAATSAAVRSSEAFSVRLDEAVHQESNRLFFVLTALTVFAAVTPLLGLLGTVIGMIETFQSISLFGTGDPKLMAGGISYALVTTQLGLSVAIPLLLLQSFLHGQANRIVEVLDEQSARLFERYEAQADPEQSG